MNAWPSSIDYRFVCTAFPIQRTLLVRGVSRNRIQHYLAGRALPEWKFRVTSNLEHFYSFELDWLDSLKRVHLRAHE